MAPLLEIFLLLYVYSTHGGCLSYEGTSFVLAFPPLSTRERGQLYILNGHTSDTTCTVTTENTTDITVRRNDQTIFDLHPIRKHSNGTYVEKSGIRVDCKNNVLLYTFFRKDGLWEEASPVLPTQSLSTEYIVPHGQGFATTIIAVSNHTLVSINNSKCYGHGQDHINEGGMSIYLDNREVFQMDGRSRVFCFLHVVGSDRIAVNLDSSSDRDLISFQLPPLNIQTTFIILPPLSGNVSRMLLSPYANYNSTDIYCYSDGGLTKQLLAGYSGCPISAILSQSESFYVMTSNEHTGIQIAPAVSDYGYDYMIPNIQAQNNSYSLYIGLVTDTECVSKFRFVANWTNITVESHQYSVASLPAPSDLIRITSTPDCKFALEVYAVGSNNRGYGFFAAPLQDPTNQGGTVSSTSATATPSPGDLTSSFNISCETNGWYIELDKNAFLSKFQTSKLSNVYLSNAFCPGNYEDGNTVSFNYSYNECNTHVQENDTSKTYSNYLVEYGFDRSTKLPTRVLWRYDILCIRPRHEIDSISFVPVDNTNGIHVQATSTIKGHQAVVEFYKDSSFSTPLTGNPLKVTTGSRVYVQVETKVSDDVKLLVDNCYVSPNERGDNSTKVPLIVNRCEDNHSVHIIGTVYKLTRFYFDVFEIPHHNDNIYVTCDVSFCDLMDFSKECQNGCLKTNP